MKFYAKKVEELGKNLGEIERVVGGKTETLRSVEDVLRGKVLAHSSNNSRDREEVRRRGKGKRVKRAE